MFVYRICKKAYSNDLLGIGAGLYGGRWNPKGISLLYTASSIALSSLEFLVHNYHLLSTASICLVKIEIPLPVPLQEILTNDLPKNWNLQLHKNEATQTIGKEFFTSGKNYVLKVPSAVVPAEFNILLNPQHINHKKTKIVEVIDPFVFDQRLLELG